MAFDLDKKYIDKVEKTLEATLPSAYKKSMMQSNGGTIELDDEVWELFPIQDNSDKKRISRSCNHILHETQIAKEWNGFPQGSLAIASNDIGDLLIFKKDDDRYIDTVYKWSHETKHSEVVADSFNDFEVE